MNRVAAIATLIALTAITACRPRPADSGYVVGQPNVYGQPNAYAQPYATYRAPSSSGREVYINGAPLSATSAAVLAKLEAARGQHLPDGSYWYDRVSGAAGPWGGPTESFLPAGLDLGPVLPRNASAGSTGVIINNREIHLDEYRWLAQLLGKRPFRGRYWLDANGFVGIEGGPALGNLVVIANQRGAVSGQRSGSNGSWGHYDRGVGGSGSIGVAGDGQTTCVNTAEYTRCY